MDDVNRRRRRLLQTAGAASVGLPALSRVTAASRGRDTDAYQTNTVLEDDRLIGTHYYVWWDGNPQHWVDGYYGNPTLGEYNSRDSDVIQQHVDWAKRAGINWFSISWWGQDSWTDETIMRDFADHSASKELHWSITYESLGLFSLNSEDKIDFDEQENRDQLVDDFKHLSDNCFDHDTYLHIDGKPVVYFYVAHDFIGDFEGAFDAAQEAIDQDVYLLFSIFITHEPTERFERLMRYADGVTSYNQYEDQEDINEDFARKATDQYSEWLLTAKALESNFIPSTVPGYDSTEYKDEQEVVLDRSTDRFERVCQRARQYADPDINAVLVTSFNEWHEGTQIEPGTSYGTTYLDTAREALGEAPLAEYYSQLTPLVFEFSGTVSEHEVNSDIEKSNSRELAIRCSEIELYDENGGSIVKFNIGTPEEEPRFGAGAYYSEQNDTRSTRWFGGSLAKTTMYVEAELLSRAYSIRVKGVSVNDDIVTTVKIDDAPVAEISLDSGGWPDAVAQLRSSPETTSEPTATPTTRSSSTRQPTTIEQSTSTTHTTQTEHQPSTGGTTQTSPPSETEASTASTDGLGIGAAVAGILSGATLFTRKRNQE